MKPSNQKLIDAIQGTWFIPKPWKEYFVSVIEEQDKRHEEFMKHHQEIQRKIARGGRETDHVARL